MNATPRLIIDDGSEYPLAGTQLIGRGDDCDIRLASDKVSRQHARITLTDDGPVIEDLGSANGTRLNGMRLTESAALMHGDTVTIDRFTLRVQLAGASAQPDDATVLADEEDATVIAGDEPPLAAAAPEEAPAADSPLPGSWVESGIGESTEFFSAGEAADTVSLARHGDLPHLLLLSDDGSISDVFELETSDGDVEQAWEIGRQADCDLVIDDSTVSTRHAQLIRCDGRWRLVNLVSSNGILVNGEKRLSVYLASGDTVQLGRRRLVFFDAVGAAQAGVATRPASPGSTTSAAGRGAGPWLLGSAVLLVVLAAAAWLLLR
jgi:pSer/pThr/pTyr-binding forkhead associated (FHA) protein